MNFFVRIRTATTMQEWEFRCPLERTQIIRTMLQHHPESRITKWERKDWDAHHVKAEDRDWCRKVFATV